MLFEVGVADVSLAFRREPIGDAENDETSALSCIEDAGAIAECAGLATEFPHLPVLEIEHLDRFDRLGNILSIRAHILHWGAAHAAGNAAEALDAGALCLHRLGYEVVPRLSRAGVEESLAIYRGSGFALHTYIRNLQNQPGPASIRDKQIAATAQDKQRQAARVSKIGSLLHLR